MTEKEFLKSYIDYLYEQFYPEYKSHPDYELLFEERTTEFLKKHHETYVEVEFLTIEEEMEFYKEMEAK